MAPQIGPKDAPTIWKKTIRCWATPVMARRAPMVTPTSVETVLGILGSIVPKLFEAMKVQKQVGASEAAAKRKKMMGASAPTLAMAPAESKLGVPVLPMKPAPES